MNEIKSGQLFAVLISVRMFSIICSTDSSDAQQMAGAAVSIAVQILVSVPILLLYKDKAFSLRKDMLFGKFGKTLYIVFFILWGALSFSNLWEVTKSVYFPIKSNFTGALILASVCVYTASLGINAVSRASGFMMGLIVFSLFIMILGAYSKADLTNFSPNATFSGVIKSAVRDFCRSGELVMMFILLELVPEGKQKSIRAFFTGKIILTEVIAVIEIAVLGKIMTISDFPFFSAGAFSQPMSIQRADSMYMILFTMLCVMTVTLQIVLSTLILDEILPDLKYKALFSAVLMAGLSSAINFTGIDMTVISGILIILLSVTFPVIMYIRRNIQNGNKEKISNSNHTAVSADNA